MAKDSNDQLEVDDLYGLPLVRFSSVEELQVGPDPTIYHVGTGHTHEGWEVTVPLLVRPKGTAEAIIGFHGSVGRNTVKTNLRWPLFERVTVSANWPWSTVLVADPSIQLGPNLNLGWYLGNSKLDLEQILNAIISKVARQLAARRLVFHGGSAGGFAALKHSSAFRDSIAFVFNPQTDVGRYEVSEVGHSLAHLFPTQSIDDLRTHSRKLSLLPYYQHPLQNFVYYLQNAGDWHREIHADPFVNFVRSRSPDHWADRLVYVLEHNRFDHAPLPASILDDHLTFAIRRFFR